MRKRLCRRPLLFGTCEPGKQTWEKICGRNGSLRRPAWQKLAIARAAYRNRDLIVLDEPTSNLDPLAETEIFKKYNSLAKDKTVIYVTHRISVAKLADRIIVFKNGKIEEDGTFDELMKLERGVRPPL